MIRERTRRRVLTPSAEWGGTLNPQPSPLTPSEGRSPPLLCGGRRRVPDGVGVGPAGREGPVQSVRPTEGLRGTPSRPPCGRSSVCWTAGSVVLPPPRPCPRPLCVRDGGPPTAALTLRPTRGPSAPRARAGSHPGHDSSDLFSCLSQTLTRDSVPALIVPCLKSK